MFPETIYGTADTWGGETYYYNEADMEQCIESLIDVGFDDSISLSECKKYKLINAIDDKATYEGGWITDGYNRNGRREVVVFSQNQDGSFEWVNSFDPKIHSDEIAELGIK